MPRRNVHIRDEDLSIWELLPNKSEFIHLALNRRDLTDRYRGQVGPGNRRFHKPATGKPLDVVTPQPDAKKGWAESTVKEPDLPKGNVKAVGPKTPESHKAVAEAATRGLFCKHGAAIGNCKHGCTK